MPLVAAETKPFEQKAVHFPSSLELRRAPAAPEQRIPNASTSTMTKQFGAAHVMINANSRIGFQRIFVAVAKTVRQFQCGSVLEPLFDAHVKIERARDAGYNCAFYLLELRRELEQAHVITFVERNQRRQIVSLESRQCC